MLLYAYVVVFRCCNNVMYYEYVSIHACGYVSISPWSYVSVRQCSYVSMLLCIYIHIPI